MTSKVWFIKEHISKSDFAKTFDPWKTFLREQNDKAQTPEKYF